jgi:ribosomal protein S18 acetylase RimI-like enzyme
MKLRTLFDADLDAVIDIHILAFPDSALTQLGREAIRRYYSWHLDGPYETLCIGAFDDIKMVGFVIAGVFHDSEIVFLHKNRIFLIWQLITHPWLLIHEVVRSRVNYSVRVAKRNIRKKRTEVSVAIVRKFGILSVAVHPQSHGLGIGKLLLQEVELSARKNKFRSMRLTVHPDNQQAVFFYEKLGWQRVQAEDGIWSGAMMKNLGNENE